MPAATAVTQSNVAAALQRALDAQRDDKKKKWTASDDSEAAATAGIIRVRVMIDFLQKYINDDAKNDKSIKTGGKMHGPGGVGGCQ